jgi:hypothetical protein
MCSASTSTFISIPKPRMLTVTGGISSSLTKKLCMPKRISQNVPKARVSLTHLGAPVISLVAPCDHGSTGGG